MTLAEKPSSCWSRGIAGNEGIVLLPMVHAHHKHGGFSKRGRDDDPLSSTLQVSASFLHGGEDPSGLHNILSTSIIPFDVDRISLLEGGVELSTMRTGTT